MKEMCERKLDILKNNKNAVVILNNMSPFVAPHYNMTSISGPQHNPQFTVVCNIQGHSAIGTGRNKKEAKLSAAQKALALITGDLCMESTNVESQRHADLHINLPERSPISILKDNYPNVHYQFVSEEGPWHDIQFCMRVSLGDISYDARGRSKKNAKIKASLSLLHHLQILDNPRVKDMNDNDHELEEIVEVREDDEEIQKRVELNEVKIKDIIECNQLNDLDLKYTFPENEISIETIEGSLPTTEIHEDEEENQMIHKRLNKIKVKFADVMNCNLVTDLDWIKSVPVTEEASECYSSSEDNEEAEKEKYVFEKRVKNEVEFEDGMYCSLVTGEDQMDSMPQNEITVLTYETQEENVKFHKTGEQNQAKMECVLGCNLVTDFGQIKKMQDNEITAEISEGSLTSTETVKNISETPEFYNYCNINQDAPNIRFNENMKDDGHEHEDIEEPPEDEEIICKKVEHKVRLEDTKACNLIVKDMDRSNAVPDNKITDKNISTSNSIASKDRLMDDAFFIKKFLTSLQIPQPKDKDNVETIPKVTRKTIEVKKVQKKLETLLGRTLGPMESRNAKKMKAKINNLIIQRPNSNPMVDDLENNYHDHNEIEEPIIDVDKFPKNVGKYKAGIEDTNICNLEVTEMDQRSAVVDNERTVENIDNIAMSTSNGTKVGLLDETIPGVSRKTLKMKKLQKKLEKLLGGKLGPLESRNLQKMKANKMMIEKLLKKEATEKKAIAGGMTSVCNRNIMITEALAAKFGAKPDMRRKNIPAAFHLKNDAIQRCRQFHLEDDHKCQGHTKTTSKGSQLNNVQHKNKKITQDLNSHDPTVIELPKKELYNKKFKYKKDRKGVAKRLDKRT